MTKSEAFEYYKENKFSILGSVITLCFVTSILIWHGVAWSIFVLALCLSLKLFIEANVAASNRGRRR